MKRVVFASVVAISVSGCVAESTNGALKREVDEVFHLAETPAQVAACFEKAHYHVAQRADGSRVVVIRNGYGGVAKTFSLYPDHSGTRIEARHVFIGTPAWGAGHCLKDSGYSS